MSISSLASARAGLGPLAPALIPVLVLIVGLDAFCLINLARSKSVRNAPKLAWVIVIIAVSAPLGALLYLFFGMDRSGRRAGTTPTAPAVGKQAPWAVSPTATSSPPLVAVSSSPQQA